MYTIYIADPPDQPQFKYCISYNDGQPTLQVISYVCIHIQLCYVTNYFKLTK